jgi:hypothetical protein
MTDASSNPLAGIVADLHRQLRDAKSCIAKQGADAAARMNDSLYQFLVEHELASLVDESTHRHVDATPESAVRVWRVGRAMPPNETVILRNDFEVRTVVLDVVLRAEAAGAGLCPDSISVVWVRHPERLTQADLTFLSDVKADVRRILDYRAPEL